MNILISRISHDTIGGAELSAFDQAVILKELGHTPVLATNLSILQKRAKEEGFRTVWFPWVNRGPGPLRMAIFLLFLPFTFIWAVVVCARVRPDIINPHSREDQNAFTLTKWVHRRPVIWKDAGDIRSQFSDKYYTRSFLKDLFRSFYRGIQRTAIKHSDHIYLLNEGDQKNLNKIMGYDTSSKTSVAPSSIIYKYYDLKAPPLPDANRKIIIGTLARLEEDKGIQYLIEAAKNLKVSGVEYWIMNDGSYKPYLENLAGGMDNIKFFSRGDNVSERLNSFDIFVHPAEVEAWGRVIKEAMYFGLPIIGSRVGGIKRQIEHNETGLLFTPGDLNELTGYLRLLITDKGLRERLGKSAQEKAVKDGDFSKIVQESILPIYQRFYSERM